MSSDDEKNDERDIVEVLRSTGRRSEPPDELTRSVRAAVEAEWREVIAQRARRRLFGRIGFSAAAALVLAAVAVWIYQPLFLSSGEKMADVSIAVGAVRVKSGVLGRWQPVAQHQAVHAGEVLATAANGRAALTLAGELSLRLDHDTRIALTDATHITIESGAVYVDSSGNLPPQEERLQVMTPAGAVRHVGTQYEARLVDSGVRIAVREGRVQLNTTAGATHLAAAGEQMTVSAAGAVERSAISRYDASWQWAATTAPGFDIDGRPVTQFLAWAGRELGRDVVFATPESEAEASRILLSGSIEGLAPDDALAAVLPTTPLRSDLRDGRLVISISTSPSH